MRVYMLTSFIVCIHNSQFIYKVIINKGMFHVIFLLVVDGFINQTQLETQNGIWIWILIWILPETQILIWTCSCFLIRFCCETVCCHSGCDCLTCCELGCRCLIATLTLSAIWSLIQTLTPIFCSLTSMILI